MLAVATVLLALANGDSRTFTPQVLDVRDHHKERVWVLLSSKCFEAEDDVHNFKDSLLDSYSCIDYNDERPKIYKHAGKSWSLWLEKNEFQKDQKFECLNKNVTLPNKLASECVEGVYWEPLEHIMQTGSCQDQGVGANLWSLDLMDGTQNSLYKYFAYSTSTSVEAIVLDTAVDTTHVEFSGLTTRNLFTGTPEPTMSYDHGTHVAGTMVGYGVGAAKDTDLNWYPVCQLGNSCAWSDIEGGYETAISHMQSNTNTKYVINYSVGGSRTSSNEQAYNNWGQRIENAGSFWATSAGNSAANACNFAPAFTAYAVTVAAYNVALNAAFFTNTGACVDIWGAGEQVYSCLPAGGYGVMSGTSMSSPNIAGLMINLIKADDYTLPQLKTKLLSDSFTLNNGQSAAFWNTDALC